LDKVPASIRLFVEAEPALAVRLVGDDGFGAALAEPSAQVVAVIGLVGEKLFSRFGSADQALGNWTIMRLAAGQEEGKKTALSIRDCVDFCIAPAARASNRLRLLPPFPPEAERCALMCVESISGLLSIAHDPPTCGIRFPKH